jgi:hypothetical protein
MRSRRSVMSARETHGGSADTSAIQIQSLIVPPQDGAECLKRELPQRPLDVTTDVR